MSKFLTLIIPCYNEENTLADCVARCLPLRDHNIELELIIVNDCSTDKSLEVAYSLKELYPNIITVLTHDVNQGKGAALRTGFIHAKGDYVGVQDADMEYNPLDYLELLQPLVDGKADVVYGSRYLKPDTRRVLYFWHTWMNKTLTFASNMFTNLDITDMETCYKLFRRDVLQNLAPKLKENRFGFEPEITAYISQEKLRVYECAISYNPRTVEEGKKIGWKDGVRALYCILHYSAHTAPLPMQLLLYFFIGAIAAVANIASFSILLSSGVGQTPAIIASFAIAAFVNYLLCIKILFRHNARWSTPNEIFAYLTTVLIMGALDYGMTVGFIALGLAPFASKVIATILGFFGNFILRKYFVF